jgi:ABC-type polysaccharide/polyol phosphate transport system ATPase subunit
MSENAIAVENLSKRYLIGHRFSSDRTLKYSSLRDVVGQEISNFLRKATDFVHGRQVVQGDKIEEFWALKDVSFEVKQGEVFGIIGRNGAGKSTLLKVLSRITEPTAGRVLMRGRVSSLLEVGTGFHPELTGRENIFLNGAILGMTQREIRGKFDEIVDFAGVERFLDTPMKRYSSGMYVRLAFAVAAHLEPEILIVDEVLAVGDIEFQNKCLGKMGEVSRKEGRTILFVSHNIEAVLRLCNRGMLIESGSVRAISGISSVVETYLSTQSSSPRVVDLSAKFRPPDFKGEARLASVVPSEENCTWSIPFGRPLSLDVAIDVKYAVRQVELSVYFSMRGFEIVTWTSRSSGVELPVRPGINTFRITFPDLRLKTGRYSLGLNVMNVDSGRDFDDDIPDAVQFEITSSNDAAEINIDKIYGVVIANATVARIEGTT